MALNHYETIQFSAPVPTTIWCDFGKMRLKPGDFRPSKSQLLTTSRASSHYVGCIPLILPPEFVAYILFVHGALVYAPVARIPTKKRHNQSYYAPQSSIIHDCLRSPYSFVGCILHIPLENGWAWIPCSPSRWVYWTSTNPWFMKISQFRYLHGFYPILPC